MYGIYIAEEQIIFEIGATSTYKNMVITLSMLKEYGCDTAIVASFDIS